MGVTDQEKKLWLLLTNFPEFSMFTRFLILAMNTLIPGTSDPYYDLAAR